MNIHRKLEQFPNLAFSFSSVNQIIDAFFFSKIHFYRCAMQLSNSLRFLEFILSPNESKENRLVDRGKIIFILFFLLVTYKRRMKSYSAKIGQSWERKLGYLRYFQKKQIKIQPSGCGQRQRGGAGGV